MQHESNTNYLYNQFCNKFSEIYKNSNTNKKHIKIRSANPWINDEIVKYCEFRDKLYTKWQNNLKNKKYEKEYKKFRNWVTKKIIFEKNNYYKQKFIENRFDLRATWQIINEIIGKKNSNIDEFIIKNFKNQNLVEILNNFALNFNYNVKKIIHTCDINTLNYSNTSISNSIYVENTTEIEIFNILKTLNVKKGAGIDAIRAKDLKNNALHLTPIITKLINSSLNQAIVPDILKTSIIRPIYKNGDKSDVNNYRPISILPVMDKILEEVVVRRLTHFLEKYKIINKNQFGFQKGKNINQLLGNFSNQINGFLSKQLHVLVLFIDFSKAFDTLEHSKLLDILERNGIRGNILNWFKNYLYCRNYCVKINNSNSKKINYNCGVPQGSKLGPILYIIYANDMMKCLKEESTYAYADDTALVISHRSLTDATQIMQDQLNIATKWCHDNGLVINANKTKLMYIKPPHIINTRVEIKFHSIDCLHKQCNMTNYNDTCTTTIEMVNTYKYLGVYIDNSFKWKSHIDYLQKKLRAASYMLYHLNNCASYDVLRQAYYSLAESYIRHGITAWGNVKYKSTLQKTQNRLLKILLKKQSWQNNNFIQSSTQHYDTDNIAKVLHILEIKNIYHITIIKEFSNNNFLHPIDHIHNTRTKSQGRYKINRFKNEYGQNTLDVTLPTLLNKIPIHILNTKNKHKRIKLVKKYLINLQ